MTFSAMWLGIALAIGFVLKKSTSEFGYLFAIGFFILSIAEIIIERKLADFKEILAILKAVITYFTFILICYIFMEATLRKPDGIVMLFVYALFPAMITYGINRFVRKSDGKAKVTDMEEIS